MNASRTLKALSTATGFVLLSGCAAMATYHEARQYVEPGGTGDQQVSRAREEVDQQRAARDRLQGELAASQTRLVALDREIADSEQALQAQERRLASAQRDRRITKAEHDRLASEINAIQREIGQLKTAAAAASSASPQELERRRAELRKRQAELESALSTVLSVR